MEDEVFQPWQQRKTKSFSMLFIDKNGYDSWDWETDNKLKDGKRTNTSSAPYPGTNAQEKKFCCWTSFTFSSKYEPYSDQSPDNVTEDMTSESVTRKFLKIYLK